MTEVNVVLSEKVKVLDVRIVMKCSVCDHQWAVRLTPNGNLPFGADVCVVCKHQEKSEQ